MASYEDISPALLARFFEAEVAKQMRIELEKSMTPIIDKAIKDAINILETSAEAYRSFDRIGSDIRITLNDKRKKDA